MPLLLWLWALPFRHTGKGDHGARRGRVFLLCAPLVPSSSPLEGRKPFSLIVYPRYAMRGDQYWKEEAWLVNDFFGQESHGGCWKPLLHP